MKTVHLAVTTRSNGVRCNHVRPAGRTWDVHRVTCSQCRGLGPEPETAPDNALRYSGMLTDLVRDEQRLNLHNVIFVDGGSLVWFEEPNIVAVMHAREGGIVRRYEGTWEPKVVTADA